MDDWQRTDELSTDLRPVQCAVTAIANYRTLFTQRGLTLRQKSVWLGGSQL
jgi:hypothetical protein